MQSDPLKDAGHPSTTVLPPTTQSIEDAAPFRYRIAARDGLKSDSDILLDQISSIDNRRIPGDLMTILTQKEISEVEMYWRIVPGLDGPSVFQTGL
jgi:mRNA-degrading endonuclease toxin of MazEF toxin-antitoxin module